MKYYHNPKCSKSRLGLDYLIEKNRKLDVIDYIKVGLIKTEVADLSEKLSLPPSHFIRKNDLKKHGLTHCNDEESWATLLVEHPYLLERPILVNNQKAAIGRPLENFDSIL